MSCRPARLIALLAVLTMAGAAHAAAQVSQPAAAPAEQAASRAWVTAGGGWATVIGDCRNCEGEPRYRHGGSILVNGGARVNSQMDAGAEVFWLPGTNEVTGDRNRATLFLGVGQFRPWRRHGFFLKGGMGVGFVRNWVYDEASESAPSYLAKGLALSYGAGWAFRNERRVGFQLFASQHVVTIGDLTTSTFVAENVIANTWTLGGSLVFR
jgi:hypothetical protein